MLNIPAVIVILLWWSCNQIPTSLDEEKPQGPTGGDKVVVSVLTLDFDYLANSFFVTVNAFGEDSIARVTGRFLHNDSIYGTVDLMDDGSGDDIIPLDEQYQGTWAPDSIDPAVDRDWIFRATAFSVNNDSATASDDIRLTLPAPPTIDWVSVPDTMRLNSVGYVFDTLKVKVSHTGGLDEIRSVQFKIKKPDTDYGDPLDLFDDGGTVLLYANPPVTSFDIVAGDGIYSFPLGLPANNTTGIRYVLFIARAWNGQVSEAVLDSLVILPALSPPNPNQFDVTSTPNTSFWN